MGSLLFRVHVAIIAFAVGTAASLIWDSLQGPRLYSPFSRHTPTVRRHAEPPPAAVPGTNVFICSVGAEAVEAALRDKDKTPRPSDLDVRRPDNHAKPQPAYPPEAVRARVSGAVDVRIVADESGRVVAAHAVSGHALLRPSAVGAACRSRFSPTIRGGRPVAAEGTLTYNFVLP
ncbi:MAG TPA: energy transducer TonB [Pyrinomonadaceae bacterium]|nr:energy transducer TonB [Pyrinomonadaceae bacterium]